MEEFIVEVNQMLTLQSNNQKLQYKPDNIFIKNVEIGIRVKEDDWIAYMACRIWNIASQKDTIFWNYAQDCESNIDKKPFLSICNYLKLKNTPKKSIWNKKPMLGWAVYLSELSIYDEGSDKLYHEILETLPSILQHSFFIKPAYLFADAAVDQVDKIASLEAANFKKIGTIYSGEIILFMKNCK